MYSRMYVSEFFSSNESFKHQLTNHSNNQYHSHEFIEIFYVIHGSAQQKINKKTIDISAGDLFLLRPFDNHSFISDNPDFCHRDFLITPNKFEEVCCFFNKNFYDSLFKQANPIHINLSQNTINMLENMFNLTNTIISAEDKDSTFSFLLSNILSCLFTEGFSNLTQGSTLWINDLIMQLNAPHNATTPIHSILEKYPYSQPYICKVFKHYTGTTPVKYFNDARLSQAYILIKSSASSISNIAEQTGFYHRSFFYKIFKEKYGITPSDVKKGIKPIATN